MKYRNYIWTSVMGVAIAMVAMKAFSQTVDLKVRVVDQDGKPVEGATIDTTSMHYLRDPERADIADKVLYAEQETDSQGKATAIFRKREFVDNVYVKKEGYYYSRSAPVAPISKDFPEKEPVEVILKEIKKPIPMYAKSFLFSNLKLPGYDGKPYGFDLEVGDWAAPHGKGKQSDLIFQFNGDAGNVLNLDKWEKVFSVNFSNPEDGLIPFEASVEFRDEMSELASSHEAPKEGYLHKWTQTTSRVKGQPQYTTRNAKRNFYFRVRTVVDNKGNIKSAHYGKIYGDFMNFIYYFNPTPNDRNVEFDPKQNLFPGEDVKRP